MGKNASVIKLSNDDRIYLETQIRARTDIVNNGWHIYLKDICTYATLSKVS